MGSAEWGSDSASFASTHAADPGPLHRRRSRRQNHRRGPSVAPLRVFPALPPMKPLRRPLCLALAGALSLLGACSSSPMSRIKAKHAVYETWPIDVLEAVVRPQVSPDMTPAMVEVALGKPTEVQSRVGKVGPEEGVDRPEIVRGFARPAPPHRAFRQGRRGQHRHAWPPGQFHHAHQRGRSGNRFPPRPRPARRVVTRASRATTAAPSMVRSAAAGPFHRAALRRDEKNPRFMA